jgi:hypothetical protein
MKIERMVDFGDGFRIMVEASTEEMVMMGQAIAHQAVSAAAQDLASRFVQEQGSSIIAKIDLQTVLIRAVAETVLKIGKAQESEAKR